MNADFVQWMYARSEKFRYFLDRYAKKEGKTPIECMNHAMALNVARHMYDEEKNKASEVRQIVMEAELIEDKSC